MLKKVLLKDKFRIIIVLFLSITLSLLSIIPQNIFGVLIDNYSKNLIDTNTVFNTLIKILIISFTFFLVQGINETCMFWGYPKYLKYFQKLILEKVLKQNPEIFRKISIGEIMSRITEDVQDFVANFFSFGYYSFVKGVIDVVIIFIYLLFKIDLIFVILINFPYIIATIFIVKMSKNLRVKYDNMVKISDKISKRTLESIKGVRIFRSYDMFKKINNLFYNDIEEYTKRNFEFLKIHINSHAYNIAALGFSYFFLIIYGYYKYSLGFLTIGDLISASLVMFLMPWPYTMLGNFIINIKQLKLGLNRLNDILNIEDSKLLNEKGINFEFKDKIEFRNFSFAYDDKEVLKDINLEIKKGETVGIIGKTGSGKTTLVKQLLRFFESSSNIYFDNIPFNEYNTKSIRENFGYIPQEYYIFSNTIKENILFNRNLEDKLEEALKISDLYKDVIEFKDGINTLVGENGISLSGGQKQRLSIARAIISNPNILIFDDSLSALDIKTEKNIIKNLSEKRLGKTNIIVSHRITSIINADKIIILDNGRITNMGRHEELLETSAWYNELYMYQNKEVFENER